MKSVQRQNSGRILTVNKKPNVSGRSHLNFTFLWPSWQVSASSGIRDQLSNEEKEQRK